MQWKWSYWFQRGRREGSGYAVRGVYENGKWIGSIYMHRLVLDAPDGTEVDHVNHNGLDNRRANLRLCTHRQNTCNQRPRVRAQCPYRGVLTTDSGKWKAQITAQGKVHYLGTFDTPEAAAHAYNEAAQSMHGRFAKLNRVNKQW